MARKSNETLLKERLAKISACPFDIFEFLTPTDELFDLIKLAEGGESNSILQLTKQLGQIYIKEKRSSGALVYLCEKGLALGIIDVALTVISYSLAVSECFSLALRALKLVSEKASGEIVESLRGTELELYAMKLVYDISKGEDINSLDYEASLLPTELFPAEHIYLFSYKLRTHKCGAEDGRWLLEHAGLEVIESLPSFCGNEFKDTETKISNKEEFFIKLDAIKDRHGDSDWRDFWLRLTYECAKYYTDGDYTAIADYVIGRAQERSCVKDKNAHALVWTRYLLLSENTILTAAEREELKLRYEQLKATCMFEGAMPDTECEKDVDRLMHEAVYTSEKEAKKAEIYTNTLGSIIRHENKRFLMECDLKGHSKRGHKHTWEFKMSMPKEYIDKRPPVFQHFKVERANPFITRGGVTLERDKASSQIICRSEIKFGETAHPFLIDIILDVTYISSVKCTLGELKIKSTKEDDKYITYTCQLLLS